MAKITAYHAPDGSISIRWPKDAIPDRATIERLAEAIEQERKSPVQSCNSEQGNTTKTAEACEHFEDTTSAALRQEAMEILLQLPAEDVEEITQRARELIRGRA